MLYPYLDDNTVRFCNSHQFKLASCLSLFAMVHTTTYYRIWRLPLMMLRLCIPTATRVTKFSTTWGGVYNSRQALLNHNLS